MTTANQHNPTLRRRVTDLLERALEDNGLRPIERLLDVHDMSYTDDTRGLQHIGAEKYVLTEPEHDLVLQVRNALDQDNPVLARMLYAKHRLQQEAHGLIECAVASQERVEDSSAVTLSIVEKLRDTIESATKQISRADFTLTTKANAEYMERQRQIAD